MWNIYQAFSESYDIKTYSSFFLYDDINIKFIHFKAFSLIVWTIKYYYIWKYSNHLIKHHKNGWNIVKSMADKTYSLTAFADRI